MLRLWCQRLKLRPLLATAECNIAVDNIAQNLARKGVRVVRIGRPEKVKEELEPLTLDSQVKARMEELMAKAGERCVSRVNRQVADLRAKLGTVDDPESLREFAALNGVLVPERFEVAGAERNPALNGLFEIVEPAQAQPTSPPSVGSGDREAGSTAPRTRPVLQHLAAAATLVRSPFGIRGPTEADLFFPWIPNLRHARSSCSLQLPHSCPKIDGCTTLLFLTSSFSARVVPSAGTT